MKQKKCNRAIALLSAAALLTALVLSPAPTAFAADDTEVIYISTGEEFVMLAESCTLDTWSQGKTVVLQADISLSGAENTTIATFGGTFDGNGHTISGLKLTQSMTPSGLFGILQENAVVKNLKVSGDLAPSGDGGSVGGIVGENYGTVVGCTFTGSVSGGSNVGGIAGVNAAGGRLLVCRTGGSVVGEKMTGGIAGCNLGVIRNCQNSAYVNTVSVDPTLRPEELQLDFSPDISRLSSMDTGAAASDTGGIAGYSSGIVSHCGNHAPVGYPHIGYNVGGIVGRSSGYIDACENDAEVFGRKDVGGIVGQIEPYIAKNVSESTLAKLERQFDELDALLSAALNDANAGVGSVTARLNRIADYLDGAAGAAGNLRTEGSVVSDVTGDGAAELGGSITVTPPQVEIEGGGEIAGGAGALVTPGGGILGGGAAAGGELQGGLTEGGAEGESQAEAGGSLSASTQITMTTNLSGLFSSVSGMSGQMRLLNGELSGVSGTLTGDMQAIQKKIGEISDTVMELLQGEGTGDILVDSSSVDIALVTSGKVSESKNRGNVSGDINVGGVAGAMAMEYELDPEDDITAGLSGKQRRTLEVKAIIQDCENTGGVAAKRSYAGGICGRMDLGLIAGSEDYGSVRSESGSYVGGIAGLAASTVRHCYAKCTLSGKTYVGGIVGSGVAEDLSGGASTVAGCCSMVDITSCQAFMGAVSGADAGDFVENYFLSDTLTGINGRSYTGRAEPISYAELAERAKTPAPESEADADPAENQTRPVSVPDAFLQLTLTFVADGETVKTVPFAYGASFDDTVYPEIPEKEGAYARWDRAELTDLHFDTVVTAVYTPYVSALSNAETRADGRPIFFVEGRFDDAAAPDVTALPSTPEDFPFLASGWTDFLAKSFSGRTVSREIVEQWKIRLPDDGQETHTVRYLAPDANPSHLDIYVLGAGGWQRAEAEVIGSYLVFSVAGREVELAAIATADVWWVWLLAGVALLLLLALLICLLRKLVRAKRKPAGPDAKATEAEAAPPEEASSPAPKKKRWLTPLLIVLAFLVGIAVTAACFLLPELLEGKKAFDLLKAYAEKPELTMELTVDVSPEPCGPGFTAALERTDVDGHRVTAISQEGRTLYYCDGAVFLENGKAYKLSSDFPDYSQLLEQAMTLYRHVDIDGADGTYTVTAEGADARAILELLMPSAAAVPVEVGAMRVELIAAGDELSELRFSANGTLQGGESTPFTLSAVCRLQPERQNRLPIPEAVKNAVRSGEYEASEALSEALLRMANAWQALDRAETVGAKLLLRADCGPVTVDDSLDLYRWNDHGTQIGSVQSNGYALYFTDTAVCDQSGRVIPAADASVVEAAKLPAIAYRICLNAESEYTEEDGQDIYTLSLDAAGMEAVAYAIAPAAEGMDISFAGGSLRVVLRGGRIECIEADCRGTVQVVLSRAEVVFSARMEFEEGAEAPALPDAVREALAR